MSDVFVNMYSNTIETEYLTITNLISEGENMERKVYINLLKGGIQNKNISDQVGFFFFLFFFSHSSALILQVNLKSGQKTCEEVVHFFLVINLDVQQQLVKK